MVFAGAGPSNRSGDHCRGGYEAPIDSRSLYNSGESAGLGGNWVDRTAGQRTGDNSVDENRHLAKVRVAGSNPVFRSKNLRSELGERKVDLGRAAQNLPITAHHLPITSV